MRFTTAALAAAFVAFGAARAAAQAQQCNTPPGTQCSINATVSVTVPTILHLEEDVDAYTFANVTSADLTAGGIDDTGHPTLAGHGNVDFTITAQAAAANFTGGAGTKPTSDMTVNAVALNGVTPVTIGTGVAGAAGITVDAAGHIAFSWANAAPATYQTTITFTIVAS